MLDLCRAMVVKSGKLDSVISHFLYFDEGSDKVFCNIVSDSVELKCYRKVTGSILLLWSA